MPQTATRPKTSQTTKTIPHRAETLTAETRAAIEEGKAMLRGDIPCRWMTPDELMKDLHS